MLHAPLLSTSKPNDTGDTKGGSVTVTTQFTHATLFGTSTPITPGPEGLADLALVIYKLNQLDNQLGPNPCSLPALGGAWYMAMSLLACCTNPLAMFPVWFGGSAMGAYLCGEASDSYDKRTAENNARPATDYTSHINRELIDRVNARLNINDARMTLQQYRAKLEEHRLHLLKNAPLVEAPTAPTSGPGSYTPPKPI